jgi:hypothetical protein
MDCNQTVLGPALQLGNVCVVWTDFYGLNLLERFSCLQSYKSMSRCDAELVDLTETRNDIE